MSRDDIHESFDDVLDRAQTTLPSPGGVEFYSARRNLWLDRTRSRTSPVNPPSIDPNSSRFRLEKMLNAPGAVNDSAVWKQGIEKVSKGLLAGGKLRRRLPLGLVIKVLHAGWLKDGTWPQPSSTAPNEEDVVMEEEEEQPSMVQEQSTLDVSAQW